MSYPPRVKICCIGSIGEAQLAIRHRASALGLVSHMPSGPGVITNELITEIAASVPPPISTFLPTYCAMPAPSFANMRFPSTIRLVDAVEPGEFKRVRRKLPHVKLVQVIHVQAEASSGEALDAYADRSAAR